MRSPVSLRVVDVGLEDAPTSPPGHGDDGGLYVVFRSGGIPVADATLLAGGTHLAPGAWRRALARARASARELDAVRAAHPAASCRALPSLCIAVCTRDRPDDLGRCLSTIAALDYAAALEVLVVDNAPSTGATQALVRSHYPGVRYLREDRPGLNWARNRAIVESVSEVIAFTDDDCTVDRRWATAIGAVFATDASVGCVTGIVLPASLDTEAQRLFEAYGGFARGYQRRTVRPGRPPQRGMAWRWGRSGQFGTGANMAFRRAAFRDIGLFDPALDAGTATQGAGDLDLFFRILKGGLTLTYEPGAVVWHRHRLDLPALYQQVGSWGSGMASYLLRSWSAWPNERWGIVWVTAWMMQHWFTRLVRATLRLTPFPASLVWTEIRLACEAPARYRRARGEAASVAAIFGDITLPPPPTPTVGTITAAGVGGPT